MKTTYQKLLWLLNDSKYSIIAGIIIGVVAALVVT